MNYTVTKSSAVLVPPANSTPSGTLPLSSIDRNLPFYMDSVSIFSHGEQPAAKIKNALAKALVHYYPVAGRIIWPKDAPHEPLVDCTGEGIWFVEAMANCSLADVNYFEMPLIISKDELIPMLPQDVKLENQIILLQITEFTCGGFAVGNISSHIIFDGIGVAQFLQAVGEMARGLLEPTVKPVWSREAIPCPPEVLQNGESPSFTVFDFVTSVVDISLDSINHIKHLFFIETGRKCSSFDIITAMIFKSRTKAINLELKDEVSLSFAVNARHFLEDKLPSMKGYYGNYVYNVLITKTTEEINNASLVEIVTLFKDAKDNVSIEFDDWINGRLNKHLSKSSNYAKLIVTDWRNTGLYEVNFGWGGPQYIFRIDGFKFVGLAIYLKPPVPTQPKQSIRLMLNCVEKEHSAEFLNEIQKNFKP